jgi:hypothetical protein
VSQGFDQQEVECLLVICHRRCCICHRFCGVKIEADCIVPEADGGEFSISNAIPVCFECHAEIHGYSPDHARGRRYTPEELRMHKDQWIEICRSKPEILLAATRNADVGSLQALVDELDFNLVIAQKSAAGGSHCSFLDDQFRRALREGTISVLLEDLKSAVLGAYADMRRANEMATAELAGRAQAEPNELARAAAASISAARDRLLELLS